MRISLLIFCLCKKERAKQLKRVIKLSVLILRENVLKSKKPGVNPVFILASICIILQVRILIFCFGHVALLYKFRRNSLSILFLLNLCPKFDRQRFLLKSHIEQ